MAITALVPAGGLGTRLLPLTRAVPKALLPVGPVPAIDHALAELAGCGVDRAIVLTSSPVSAPLHRYVDSLETSPIAVEVREIPWTLGMREVLAYARREVAAPQFVMLLPDEILSGPETMRALVATSLRHRASTAAVSGDVPPVFRFGAVREPEEPGAGAADAPTMIGRFVLRSEALARVDAVIAADGGPLTLPALLSQIAGVSAVVGVRCVQPHWDIGSMPGYLRAVREFAVGPELCG